MYSLSLNEATLDFKTLEHEIYKIVCEVACNALTEVLGQLDKMLMATRETGKYRHKGIRKTHVHTMMGTVEYDRRIYESINDEGKKQYVYLLDEYLNNETIGHVSSNLSEKIIERALEESYRKTAQALESTSNSSLSHTTAWNVIQKVGSKLEEKEKRLVKEYDQGNLSGDTVVEVLFQEADGVWLSMQDKDRSKKSRKKEMKIGINYEGFKRRPGQIESYEVHNKTVCVGFHKSHEFKRLWEAKVAEKYDIDEIKTRVVNGDGDAWIKPDFANEGVHFQLDPFHISRAVLKKVPEKEEAKHLNKMLKRGEVKESFEYLTALLIKYHDDEDAFEKLEELYNYLHNNYDGLVPYRLRDIYLPKLPDGLVYRGMGIVESDVCNVITLRMKNRKMSWSEEGAINLARLLALRASGTLYDELAVLFDDSISDEMLEEMVEIVQLSAAQVNKSPKRSNAYPAQKAPIPFEGQALTAGRKAIRDLVENRIASDLNFIY